MMQADFRIISNFIYQELHESTSLEQFRNRVNSKLREWKKTVFNCETSACLGILIYDLMRNQKRELRYHGT